MELINEVRFLDFVIDCPAESETSPEEQALRWIIEDNTLSIRQRCALLAVCVIQPRPGYMQTDS